jgi:hypothetical protein
MRANGEHPESEKPAHRWRFSLFQRILPPDGKQILPNLTAGVTLAAMNIPGTLP